MGVAMRRAMVILVLVWLSFLLIAVGFMRHEPDQATSLRISQALRDLQSLHQQRQELSRIINEYSSGAALKVEEKEMLLKTLNEKFPKAQDEEPDCRNGPPAEYEKTRRRIQMGVDEIWFYANSELKALHKELSASNPQAAAKIERMLDDLHDHKRSLKHDVLKLPKVDGYTKWRENEARELSDLVQRRLHHLQNPQDCNEAQKLVCNLNKGCGYGCQLHHAAYCLIVAYGTERTLVLNSKGWRYNHGGWEKVFKPVSDVCTTATPPVVNWPGTNGAQNVMLGIVDSVVPRPPFLPLAVPDDLAPRLSRLHGDPIVWWVGQFLKFLLRPQSETANLLDVASNKFKFARPIVGVHIRRTDKVGTEAQFHSADEYMIEVEEYFKQLALKETVDQKRIYLASDDPKVFAEIKSKYKDYEVLGDPLVAKTAAVSTRYTDSSLNGIIMDIHFLSQCDYLVCTFSSQVCRVAYEIMQTMHTDASSRFRSLDDIYYYGGQAIHKRVAILPHKARSSEEIDLEVGDLVGVAGNHWNGYSKGKNLRTNLFGLYPSYKVDDVMEVVEFPKYPEVS